MYQGDRIKQMPPTVQISDYRLWSHWEKCNSRRKLEHLIVKARQHKQGSNGQPLPRSCDLQAYADFQGWWRMHIHMLTSQNQSGKAALLEPLHFLSTGAQAHLAPQEDCASLHLVCMHTFARVQTYVSALVHISLMWDCWQQLPCFPISPLANH